MWYQNCPNNKSIHSSSREGGAAGLVMIPYHSHSLTSQPTISQPADLASNISKICISNSVCKINSASKICEGRIQLFNKYVMTGKTTTNRLKWWVRFPPDKISPKFQVDKWEPKISRLFLLLKKIRKTKLLRHPCAKICFLSIRILISSTKNIGWGIRTATNELTTSTNPAHPSLTYFFCISFAFNPPHAIQEKACGPLIC